MADQTPQWHPPQEKYIKWAFNGALGLALLIGASVLIKTTVPTISDALILLRKMFENGISMAITGAALAFVIWLIWESFSPSGSINKLFAQAYSSFIHHMTLELLNVDPMSPLKDSLAAVEKKKDYYDEQFAQFDGQISKLKESIDGFRTTAKKAESRAKAAQTAGNKQAFDQAAYEAGSSNDTADNLQKMVDRLAKVREIIVRLQGAASDLIFKLGIDIKQTQAQWDAQQSVTGMEGAARSIISSSGKSALAKEAQDIVASKYAISIGRLENLDDLASPLLNSIDMDKATYSQELLDKWNAEATPLQISAQATVLAPAMGATGGKTGGFANLIGDN